jgi:hypothetical protein
MIPGRFTKSFLAALCSLLIAFIALGTGCNRNSSSISLQKVTDQRLKWNLQTTVEAYDQIGVKDSKWDDAARKCLTAFAHSRAEKAADDSSLEIISTNAAAAVAAGCKDPMVNYLFIKFAMPQTNSKEAFANRFAVMARDMNASGYPAVRKFYANARAMDQYYYTYDTNVWSHPEMSDFNQQLYHSFADTVSDKTLPSDEAFDANDTATYLMKGASANNQQMFYDVAQQQLLKNQPNDYLPWYLKGNHEVEQAWMARGNGTGDTVTPEGAAEFQKHLVEAREDYQHAWKLNPKRSYVAIQMMTVVLGQGGDRKEMEQWFSRAMELDTNSYDACRNKMNFLDPKWYGSDEQQLAFGRECAQSTKWGGHVPLILVLAHNLINQRNEGAAQADYWKQSEVWIDMQSAYDRFFELNPEETYLYNDYALHAYEAEQWDKLNELIPKIEQVNYDRFGGKQEYDKMVRLAKEHGGSK